MQSISVKHLGILCIVWLPGAMLTAQIIFLQAGLLLSSLQGSSRLKPVPSGFPQMECIVWWCFTL